MTNAELLRCPSCRHLIAARRPDGSLELRARGRPLARVERGSVHCRRCGVGAVSITDRLAPAVVFPVLGESDQGEAA